MKQIKNGTVTGHTARGIRITCRFRTVTSEQEEREVVEDTWFPKKCVSVTSDGAVLVQSWLVKEKETDMADSIKDADGDCMTCELLLVDDDEGEE